MLRIMLYIWNIIIIVEIWPYMEKKHTHTTVTFIDLIFEIKIFCLNLPLIMLVGNKILIIYKYLSCPIFSCKVSNLHEISGIPCLISDFRHRKAVVMCNFKFILTASHIICMLCFCLVPTLELRTLSQILEIFLQWDIT